MGSAALLPASANAATKLVKFGFAVAKVTTVGVPVRSFEDVLIRPIRVLNPLKRYRRYG